jgi:cyclopropane-fatty-acyl-phospholipid synthase
MPTPTPIIARSSILAVLEQAIKVGHLTISDSEGTHYFGRREKDCNDVYIKVINSAFWIRIMLSGDLGCEHQS